MNGKSTGQELSDVFYGLQIIVKIVEGLTQEYDAGHRTQNDYEQRFHSQVTLLCRALADVRPLAEKLISDGYSKYEQSPERTLSDSRLLTGDSSRVADSEQVSD